MAASKPTFWLSKNFNSFVLFQFADLNPSLDLIRQGPQAYPEAPT